MGQQLFFDLDFGTGLPRAEATRVGHKRQALQRAVLMWLERIDPPHGAALNVVTRVSRLRADVAAFWSSPVRNRHEEGPSQILVPSRTTIVQCHIEREECWPDCIRSHEILPQLRDLKNKLAEVEEQIRVQEPGLRDDNTLFEEYAEWNYEKSTNREYHRLKRAIEKMEHGLYHGTKFERIRSAQLADHLYLAVPEGVVQPEELADGWGLLWIANDLTISEVGKPEQRECLTSNRSHLVQNIAAAAKNDTLFAAGIRRKASGDLVLVKPPHARRKSEDIDV